MNYLAHLVLAGDDPADRLGGLAGDFVKGVLPGSLPADLAAGVRLHRAIDQYADAHPAFRQSRERVSSLRRRYAGVMVDMFYDHFLAVHWARYRDEPLRVYTRSVYGLVAERAGELPASFGDVAPHMAAQDWLASYRDPRAIATALDRMSQHRLRRANPLAGGGLELLGDYAGFEADFLVFFPDAQAFTASLRADRDRAGA